VAGSTHGHAAAVLVLTDIRKHPSKDKYMTDSSWIKRQKKVIAELPFRSTTVKKQTIQKSASFSVTEYEQDDLPPGNYTLRAVLRYDDQCGNGYNSFAIVGDLKRDGMWIAGGCLHDEISKRIPEWAPLTKWHLCGANGPMYYLSNTVYLAGNRDCWGRAFGDPCRWRYTMQFGDMPLRYPFGRLDGWDKWKRTLNSDPTGQTLSVKSVPYRGPYTSLKDAQNYGLESTKPEWSWGADDYGKAPFVSRMQALQFLEQLKWTEGAVHTGDPAPFKDCPLHFPSPKFELDENSAKAWATFFHKDPTGSTLEAVPVKNDEGQVWGFGLESKKHELRHGCDKWYHAAFATEESALAFIQAVKWSGGVTVHREVQERSHGKQRQLHAAREAACWPEATDTELMREPDRLRETLLRRLPSLMTEFYEAVTGLGLEY
jgi:hypothetical protein